MSDEVINEVGFESNDETDFLDGKTLVDDTAAEPSLEKPEEGKTDDGKEPTKEPVPPVDKAVQAPASKKEDGTLSGFAQRFMKKGDKGESIFDSEGALSFIKPGNGKDAPFRYDLKPRKAAEATVDGKPAEPVNPFKQKIEERKTWRKERENEAFLWRNAYSEAINAGYEARGALQIADSKVRDYIEEKQADWEYERETKSAEEKHRGELSAKQQAEARSTRLANEQQYVQKLGGHEAYNEFLFGKKGPDGKAVPGYASDFIGKLFDMANPDEKEVTVEKMEQWWDSFASDRGNLQVVYEVGMARLQQELFPHLMQKAVSVHKETERQKEMGKARRPDGAARSLAPESEEVPGDLAGFFRPPNSNEVVDTI